MIEGNTKPIRKPAKNASVVTRNAWKSPEQIIDELKTVSVKMGTLIEQHNHKLEDHDERIVKLEIKPAKRWDSVVGKIIEYAISFGFGALLVWLGFKDKM